MILRYFSFSVCLRLQVNPQNRSQFHGISPERGFADFIFAHIILHIVIKFIEMGIFRTSTRIENHTWNREGRVQDKEFLEMFDQGLCLSMHQPYASLLVAGIKT